MPDKPLDPLAPPVEPVPAADVVAQAAQAILFPDPRLAPKATSFPGLDTLLAGGVTPGDLIYLSALSSVGKSAFALQLAHHRARQGDTVLIVSQEMTNLANGRRLLAQTTPISATRLKRGREALSPAEKALLAGIRSEGAWLGLPLYFTAEARSINTILHTVHRWRPPAPARPLSLLVIDYLQLTEPDVERGPGVSERQQLEAISRRLKEIAVAYNLVVLCLSAANPDDEDPDKPVSRYSLRGSRRLTFDADVVLAMNRALEKDRGTLEVVKARDGQVGRVKVQFMADSLRFGECSDREEGPPAPKGPRLAPLLRHRDPGEDA